MHDQSQDIQSLLRERLARRLGGATRVPSRPYRASPAQEQLWYSSQLDPTGAAFTNAAAARVRGKLDLDVLEAAFRSIVDRHAPLRCAFGADDDGALIVRPTTEPFVMSRADVSDARPEVRKGEADRLAMALATRPFELRSGPLFRTLCIRIAPDEHLLVIAVHHIVSDGYSFQVLLQDLAAFYEKPLTGDASDLPPLTTTYEHFAQSQRLFRHSKRFAEGLEYWREQLGDAPRTLDLPTDHPRPSTMSMCGARHDFHFSSETSDAVREFARKTSVTPFAVATASLILLLRRLTGASDVCFATPIWGRDRDQEALIGLFVNLVVVRVRIAEEDTFTTLCHRTSDQLRSAIDRGEIPLQSVVEVVTVDRRSDQTPLYQVIVAQNNAPTGAAGLPGLSVELSDIDGQVAQTDLQVSLRTTSGPLRGFVEYATDLFEASTIAHIVDGWSTLTLNALVSPSVPLADLEAVSATEQRRILVDWSGPDERVGEVTSTTLHGMAMETAKQRPDNVAVAFDGRDYSYRELSDASGAVCTCLRDHGVAQGDRVGLVTGRSFNAIAAILGILRSGGVFVPVSRDVPLRRREQIVGIASCSLTLVDDDLDDPSGEFLVRLSDAVAYERDESPDVVDPTAPAYVMPTSGSSGTPKGVLVSHRAAVSRVLWKTRAFPLSDDDVILSGTSLIWDVSVWEIFWALCVGAPLLVPDEATARNPAKLLELIRQARPSVIHATPSQLRLLVTAAEGSSATGVRWMITTGEKLTRDLLDAVHDIFGCAVCTMYGVTEATICSTWEIHRPGEPKRPITLGRPFGDAKVYVLDERARFAPSGGLGEIYLGGPSIAEGYVGQPDETAERFVADPFSGSDARMYRTGDFGRFTSGGHLRFLGRADEQIKLSGERIEPAEIVGALREHPGVADCAVVLEEEEGVQRLVAYVVPRNGMPSEHELTIYLNDRLASIMVPTAFRPIGRLPLLENGKLDREVLREKFTPTPDDLFLNGASNGTEAGAAVQRGESGERTVAPAPRELSRWFYRPSWKPRDLGRRAPAGSANWLVVGDASVSPIVEELRRGGGSVTTAAPGRAFGALAEHEYDIDPTSREDWLRLLATLESSGGRPDVVLHLWGLCAGLDPKTESRVARSFSSIVEIVRALGEQWPGENVSVYVASVGQHALCGTPDADPFPAMAVGVLRVASAEYPGLRTRSIDLDAKAVGAPQDLAGTFLREYQADCNDLVVAYRDGMRWSQDIEETPLPPQPEVLPAIRRGGTYMITGGLGGLGLAFADFLSSRYQASLVLVSRHGITTSLTARRVRMLEERGSRALVLSADIADREQLGVALAATREQLGHVNGVIHAAGVSEHKLLAALEAGDAEAVLRPKVLGTLALYEILKPEPELDFVILFSSTSAMFGGRTSAAYGAASCFLDAFSLSHQSTSGPRVVSIGWGPWREVGVFRRWEAPASLRSRADEVLATGMTNDEGFQAFARVLAGTSPHVIVSTLEPIALRLGAQDVFSSSATATAVTAVDAPSAAPTARPPTTVGRARASDALTNEVTEIWRKVLGVETLEGDGDFFDQGGHSLLLMNLANRLAKRYGKLLPLAKLFEEPTIEACVAMLRDDS